MVFVNDLGSPERGKILAIGVDKKIYSVATDTYNSTTCLTPARPLSGYPEDNGLILGRPHTDLARQHHVQAASKPRLGHTDDTNSNLKVLQQDKLSKASVVSESQCAPVYVSTAGLVRGKVLTTIQGLGEQTNATQVEVKLTDIVSHIYQI